MSHNTGELSGPDSVLVWIAPSVEVFQVPGHNRLFILRVMAEEGAIFLGTFFLVAFELLFDRTKSFEVILCLALIFCVL